ncbi:MAG TPA: MFS transporter [Firmicutes bacterium]|jgi:MFS family permease|nr:MFS transporter [Candidatus Fermentithermobacillaceae bacterium]
MLLDKLKVCSYITGEAEKRNARISIIDGMLFSVMSGLTGPFWGAFAVKLGATDYTLALLASLPALVSLVAQVPSALFVERYENRLRPTVIAAGISRSFYMLFAVLILLPLPGPTKALVFVLMYSLMNLPGTVCGVAWTSMMGDMFSSSIRGRFFGERNMLCTFVSLIATVLSGPFLDSVPWPLNYVLLYVVSFGTVMGSLYYLTKHEDPPVPKDRGTPATGLSAFGRSIADKSFVRFLVAVFAIHTGFHIPASLWTILWVKEMGLSNSWLGAFSIGAGLMSFLTYRSWGRWSEQYGNMKVLVLTALAHMPFPLLYAHLRSPYVYLAINLVGGFAGAGMNLSLFNALLDVSPKEGRPAYVALYNITTGFSGFVWPFFGVWMYRTMGLTSALDFSAVARIIGMGLAFVLVSRGQKVPDESRPERAS